jgi:deoxyribodipyrimidine photolyase-related protein
LVESAARSSRLPYQRKKLVLLFSAMRHYAAELRAQGWQVEVIQAQTTLAGLRQHLEIHQPARLLTMAASEAAGRRWQQERLSELLGLPVETLPNTQFLIGQFDPYPDAPPDKRIVMEYFYRAMRRHFGLLMTPEGQPVGGEWNYDTLNRKPLPKNATPPAPPSFPPDAITRQVIAEVAALPHATGTKPAPAPTPVPSTFSTGISCWSTKRACAPTPAWATPSSACAIWTTTNGRACANRRRRSWQSSVASHG